MKKVVSACLLFFVFCSTFLLINVYQTKDRIRIESIEMNPGGSFYFYVKHSNRTIPEELTFLSRLSKEEKISIFKTDYTKNDTVIKSVVFNKESFPFQQFNLPDKDLFKNSRNIYASFDTKSKHQVGRIPTFVKRDKVFLQLLENYYLDSSKSLNGTYSVVSTQTINKEKIVKKLSIFFSVSEKELLTTSGDHAVALINRYVMIFALIIILVFLVLMIVTIYAPLMSIKSIGVKKLNGISNFAILGEFIKKNVILLIGSCFLVDVGILAYFPYRPKNFMLILILVQLLIFMIFFISNCFVYLVIRKVTIGKLLKQFLNFKCGNAACFVVKFLLTLSSTLLLFQISGEIDELVKQYRLSEAWNSNGELLTVEVAYVSEEEGGLQNFHLNELKAAEKCARLFLDLDKQTKAMYVCSSVIDPTRNLGMGGKNQEKNIFKPGEKYEVMSINHHFLKTLPIKHKLAKDNIREFLVPNSLRQNEAKMRYFCQRLLFNDLGSKDQETTIIEHLPVRLFYYDDQHFSVFPYSSEIKGNFTKPILKLFNEENMLFCERTYCSVTGENCPMKVMNSKQNREKIQKLMKKNDVHVKFSTVNAILGDQIRGCKEAIGIVIMILFFIVILNIFALIFLLICIIRSKKKKLSVDRLLGVKMFDRYRVEFCLIFGSYFIQILMICLLGKSLLVMPIALIVILIESITIFLTIIREEKKNLVSLLKGE
ncbi:MAG: hypothetical protein LBT69_00595 [Lactobacillales bacterium]|jgi:hypothetical protein|nr:hypothetical protein [Lactobacillales bacterium]